MRIVEEGNLPSVVDLVQNSRTEFHIFATNIISRSVLGSWGKPMRDAVRNKGKGEKGASTPTQDPSTDLVSQPARTSHAAQYHRARELRLLQLLALA